MFDTGTLLIGLLVLALVVFLLVVVPAVVTGKDTFTGKEL